MHQEQIAWAAGFFDAEGCSSRTGLYPLVTVSQANPEPLERFVGAVESAKIRGPFTNNGKGTKPMWSAYAYTWRAVSVIRLLLPHLSEPKREQARSAFAWYPIDSALDTRSSAPPEPRARIELAWCAGFVEGDGSFSYSASTGTPVVSIRQNELQPLERVERALGLGKIYGPYERRETDLSRSPYWNYRAHGFERVQAITAMLWPWLGPAKREQAARVLALARARTATCVRGHPKVPGKRACPACVREHWRMRREGTLFEPTVPYLAG